MLRVEERLRVQDWFSVGERGGHVQVHFTSLRFKSDVSALQVRRLCAEACSLLKRCTLLGKRGVGTCVLVQSPGMPTVNNAHRAERVGGPGVARTKIEGVARTKIEAQILEECKRGAAMNSVFSWFVDIRNI